jgi:uncharacterized SAM-binding protein YcdF (DUF218 family)
VKLLTRTLFYLSVAIFTLALIIAGNYLTLPTHNTAATRFDTLVVLGTPANLDGTASPEQRERVLEGVRQYKSGIAPHIIMTGAAAHNQYVEAHVMSQLAQAQGVPATAIVEEPQAQNTIQNIYYSAQIMHHENWGSAEVISSPHHLGRTALILNALNTTQPTLSIDWHTQAAHWPPEYTLPHELLLDTHEAWHCLDLRIHGFPSSKFLPSH